MAIVLTVDYKQNVAMYFSPSMQENKISEYITMQ